MPVADRRSISTKTAAEWLSAVSRENFGENPELWSEWLKKNRWAYYRSPFKQIQKTTKSKSRNT
jgi:hypothetical protein